MKKLLTIFTLLLLALGCTKEIDISQDEMSGDAVKFTASVVDATETKATLINSWSGGEQVALFVDGDETVYHFTIAADGTMSGDEVIVDREASITYTAFYPYDSYLSTIEAYQEACTAGDVDYMSATTTTSGKEVALQFSHQMAAITYSFVVAPDVELPTISLAVDGNINTMVALDLEKMKTTATAYKYEASYFIADGTDVSSMLVKIEQGGSTTIQSITREGLSSVEAGKQYLFSYTIGDLETGAGVEGDPYIVYTADDMRKVGTDTDGWALSSHYILAWDIDLGSEEFTTIGTSYTYSFTGTFDGDGHEISGLYINQPSSDRQGLFGYANGATIKNLGVSGSVIGNEYVGGIAGYANFTSMVSGCYNSCSVEGSSGYVGGVVGDLHDDSKIENCYNTGLVKASSEYIGGITGYTTGTATISGCYNSGSVEGTNSVGGVVGLGSGSVSDCYNNGSVKASSKRVGGVVGYTTSSTVSNCYNTGSVEGSSGNVGGVVGYNYNSSTVNNCYNTGSVEGTDYVGGVVGYNFHSSTVNNCYNTGSVEGTSYVGGVVGYNYNSSSTVNCYYLSTAYSGNGVGYNDNSTVENVSSKTADEMKSTDFVTLLNGEDGTSWISDYATPINNGYPILTWQTSNN